MSKQGIDRKETEMQSMKAFNKWKKLWINNCKENKPRIKTTQRSLLNKYKDKTLLLIAYGPSFKDNIKEIKEKGLHVDKNYVIGCVDKAFRPLIKEMVYPEFCLIADGHVSAKEWLYGVDDKENDDIELGIGNCLLISNVYGCPDWPKKWEEVRGATGIYWYLNKDSLNVTENNKYGTAEYFGPMVDYYEMIEAASNVGNSLAVFSIKIFGCKHIMLFGYDYSWGLGNYYGSVDHKKRVYMPHERLVDCNNDIVFSSPNMIFSSKWLIRYITYAYNKYKVIIDNYSEKGLLKSKSMKGKLQCQNM